MNIENDSLTTQSVAAFIDSLSQSIQRLEAQNKDTSYLEDKLKEIVDSLTV